MMIKDRLSEFQHYQEKDDASSGHGFYLVRFEETDKIDFVIALPPHIQDFLHNVFNLQRRIIMLEELVRQLKSIHDKLFISTETEFLRGSDLRKEESLTKIIKENSSYLYTDIKDLEYRDRVESGGSNALKDKIRICQISVLFENFHCVMDNFKETQMLHRQKCRDKLIRQLEICGSQTSLEQIEEMSSNGFYNAFHSTQLISEFSDREEILQNLEMRHSHIIHLERCIKDLHGLFNDMAIFVDLQGFLLENIGEHTRKASAHLANCGPRLRSATIYKRRTLLSMCCSLF